MATFITDTGRVVPFVERTDESDEERAQRWQRTAKKWNYAGPMPTQAASNVLVDDTPTSGTLRINKAVQQAYVQQPVNAFPGFGPADVDAVRQTMRGPFGLPGPHVNIGQPFDVPARPKPAIDLTLPAAESRLPSGRELGGGAVISSGSIPFTASYADYDRGDTVAQADAVTAVQRGIDRGTLSGGGYITLGGKTVAMVEQPSRVTVREGQAYSNTAPTRSPRTLDELMAQMPGSVDASVRLAAAQEAYKPVLAAEDRVKQAEGALAQLQASMAATGRIAKQTVDLPSTTSLPIQQQWRNSQQRQAIIARTEDAKAALAQQASQKRSLEKLIRDSKREAAMERNRAVETATTLATAQQEEVDSNRRYNQLREQRAKNELQMQQAELDAALNGDPTKVTLQEARLSAATLKQALDGMMPTVPDSVTGVAVSRPDLMSPTDQVDYQTYMAAYRAYMGRISVASGANALSDVDARALFDAEKKAQAQSQKAK